MATTILVSRTMTVTAAEMYLGVAATYTLPIVWTTSDTVALALTPSSDTLSCAVKCNALSGVGSATVTAAITGGPSANTVFAPALGVDAIVLTVS